MSLQAFANLFPIDWPVWLATTAVVATFLYKRRQSTLGTSKNGVPLPPGPPARWFWENPIPATNLARTLADWVAEYGPVVTLRQGSNVVVVVGRVEAVAEIMEKDGSVLADRPRSIAAGEFVSRDLRLALLRSGERLRRFRRAAHAHLQQKAIGIYQDMQLEDAKNVITDILDDPKNHKTHVQRFAASIILRVAYGKSTPTLNDDPEVVRVHQAMNNLQRAMRPGAYFVDRFPLLKYIPGYGRELKEYHNFELELFREQMDRVLSEMENNRSGDSFVRTLLEHVDEHRLSKDEMAYLAGNLYGGGSETSAAGITNMILAAACHTEAQKRAQEELDTVIGKDRTPSWNDSDSLPQVHAFVLETLRWRPVLPYGIPHCATRDIIWRGQCIPAGATVIGCHLAISRDPVAFPQPEKFDPQRWIDDGRLRNDMTSYAFGFGRRVCPGRYLGYRSLFVNLALLLWSFRIEQRPDAPIDTNAYTDTMIAHAAPFEVEFIPQMELDRLKEMMGDSGV